MSSENCLSFICFAPLDLSPGPDVFDFKSFTTALALFLVLYSIADIRYKFRLTIAPGKPIQESFYLVIALGILLLLTDLWEANQWLVPQTSWLTNATWEATLGFLFLTAFLTLVWYGFIRPPIFSARNSRTFSKELYTLIARGNENELPIIADELERSIASLVRYSEPVERDPLTQDRRNTKRSRKARNVETASLAHDTLIYIANRKFCRHIAESTPITAYAVFHEMTRQAKYALPVGEFGAAVTAEVVLNKDSVLHHENRRAIGSFLASPAPWTRTIYGNYKLISQLEMIGITPLDVRLDEMRRWDSAQWRAYGAALIATIEGYLRVAGPKAHASAICRPLSMIGSTLSDLRQLDESEIDLLGDDRIERLRTAVDFAGSMVSTVETATADSDRIDWNRYKHPGSDIYDWIAEYCYELIFHASAIRSPQWLFWFIQHNTVWSEFFLMPRESPAWKAVQFRLRRLLYNDIREMDELSPNFRGVRTLGVILNVVGFERQAGSGSSLRAQRPIAIAACRWAQRNYARMRKDYPEVAEAMLFGRLSYDEKNNRLIITLRKGLKGVAPQQYLDLDDV